METHFLEHGSESTSLWRRIRPGLLAAAVALLAGLFVAWIAGPTWDRFWMRVQLGFNGTLSRYRARPLADLRGMRLGSKDLRDAVFAGVRLADADLRRANAEGARFARADLERAVLAEANLRNADFREANLAKANLKGADLRNACLEGAILEGADLEGAELQGAELDNARLVGAKGIPWRNLFEARDWELAAYGPEEIRDLHELVHELDRPAPPRFDDWETFFERQRSRWTGEEGRAVPSSARASNVGDREPESLPGPR